jgi:putative thioredoxin
MAAVIYDVSEKEFATSVLERSKQVPVVVDFWAGWCGPCKTLGPILEKVATEGGGSFELAKVDVDSNPRLSQSFGVQGIPTVIAFMDGKPVDRFTGALPEQAVRQFVSKLALNPETEAVAAAMAKARAGDMWTAEAELRALLGRKPDNTEASLGLVTLLIGRGERTEASEMLAKLAPTPEVRRLLAAVRLIPTESVDVAGLESKLMKDPADFGARLELGKVLSGYGRFEEALSTLLSIVSEDGDLRNDARQIMLDIFEVLGTDHPLVASYRRRLANALF